MAPGEHCHTVERTIRDLKDEIRGRAYTWPFLLTEFWWEQLVLAVVTAHNIRVSVPASTGSTPGAPAALPSPASVYYNRILDVNKDIKFKAGQLADAVFPATTNNVTGPRSERVVVIRPTLQGAGGYVCIPIETRRPVVRKAHALRAVPWPTDLLNELSDEAIEEGCSQRRGPAVDAFNLRGVGPAIVDEAEIGGAMADEAEIRGDADEIRGAADGEPDDQGGEGPARAARAVHFGPLPAARRGRTGGSDSLGMLPPAARYAPMGGEAVLFNKMADEAGAAARAASRETPELVRKISAKAALSTMPERAIPSIQKELQQMLTRKVWVPVHFRTLTPSARMRVLRTTMFCRDKRDPDGQPGPFKSRLVAGGDQQDKGLFAEGSLSSPTVSTTSLFVVAAIAADEERDVMTMDVGGAFLNADMPQDGTTVHVKIDPTLASHLVTLDPTYTPFVDGRGCIIVELKKALYGTVQAAKLWYDLLVGVLVEQGFKPNPYDPCVLNRTAGGRQVTLALHVDDMFVTSAHRPDLEELAALVASKWPGSTVHHGPRVNFVGMTFDFEARAHLRVVEVTMDSMTDAIIAESGVQRAKPSPCTEKLFEVDSQSPPLAPADAATFASIVAKTAWMAKRVRPEIATAIGFLTTRASAPTEEDRLKFVRVCQYLFGSPRRGIALGVGEEGIRVRTHIDAAYGVHSTTGKSHSGCAISLGKGPVYTASKGQKIVTKSSTEAELVALSDMASQAIHVRGFVMEQGYDTGPATIYQTFRAWPWSAREDRAPVAHTGTLICTFVNTGSQP